ncbi:hypothetical protein V5799_033950 [Amblyomma americanum]|uniref:Peptidase M13 C-terminal domain-containing protein n=1 Tax=Amblyomma americanum TaxID=6943 RepID=A0AAQ4DLV5_AMBAM
MTVLPFLSSATRAGHKQHFLIGSCSLLNAKTSTLNTTALREAEDAIYDVARAAKHAPTSTQVWFPLYAFEDYMSSVSADLWHQLLVKHLNGSKIVLDANDTVLAHSSVLLMGLDKLFVAYASRSERLLEGVAWVFVERYLWTAGEAPNLRFATGVSTREEKAAACILQVDSRLGIRSAAAHVRERFNASSRAGLHAFVERIARMLQESLGGLSWIGQSAAHEAKRKLSGMKLDIFPSERLFDPNGVDNLYGAFSKLKKGVKAMSFIDYFILHSGTLRRYLGSDHYEDVYRRRLFDTTAPLVEYFYYPNSLRISLVALETPLYSPDGTFAMNFGGLGTYVARELSRSFDAVGTLVDSQGGARTWWGPTESADYKSKLSCDLDSTDMVEGNGSSSAGDTAHRVELFPHVPALEALYRAYKHATTSNEGFSVDVMHLPNLEDYTADQVFFLTFCHTVCTHKEDPEAVKLCNLPLKNLRSFADAFHCPVGSPMNPLKKCTFFES